MVVSVEVQLLQRLYERPKRPIVGQCEQREQDVRSKQFSVALHFIDGAVRR